MQLFAAAGALLLPTRCMLAKAPPRASTIDLEVHISPVSTHTFRLSILPISNGQASAIPSNGSLVQGSPRTPDTILRGDWRPQTVAAGNVRVHVSPEPLTFTIERPDGSRIQQLTVDSETGAIHFETGNSPLLGLGEGGPQFDRRGSIDPMISGQGAYALKTHGGRVPIPWSA